MIPLFSPLDYDWPVFRPPSEASSLILQVTSGCSWNRCTFCEMYQGKPFRTRSPEEIELELQAVARVWPETRRLFLADGDPLVLSSGKLLAILQAARRHLPALQRISAYASPQNLDIKSVEELRKLREAGLSLVYVGIESGCDQVLERVQKGERAESIVSGLNKAREAGIRRSVMILVGLGGALLSQVHAEHSARVANQTQPEYLSTLVLSFPRGEKRFQQGFGKEYRSLNLRGHLQEMHRFLACLELDRTVFRSDHVSNVLALRGTLNRDRPKLLSQLDQFLQQVEQNPDAWEKEFSRRDHQTL